MISFLSLITLMACAITGIVQHPKNKAILEEGKRPKPKKRPITPRQSNLLILKRLHKEETQEHLKAQYKAAITQLQKSKKR